MTPNASKQGKLDSLGPYFCSYVCALYVGGRVSKRFPSFGLFFFCSVAGEREEASEEVAGGGSVSIENRRRGVLLEEEAREGEGTGGMSLQGKGGAHFFFLGAEIPPLFPLQALSLSHHFSPLETPI